jgi:hypothetical protein
MTTAKTHLENIFQKTGVKRQAELMRLARARAPSRRALQCGESDGIAVLVHVVRYGLVIDARLYFVPSAHEDKSQARGR